ncbi:MAG TPA: hypothetical protein VFN61_03125 [Acidimicrobiales bacterium]|nr:hypothetical protein [Acidimicrobiales bacterium]
MVRQRVSGLLVRKPILWVSLLAGLFTLLTWPGTQLAPQAGLDQSWQAGLAMALEKHLAWGPRIDFTYGPLGFLVVPELYYHLTATLSLAYLACSRWLLYALLLGECRRKLPPLPAAAATFVVGATTIAIVDGADLLMACALLIYVAWTHARSGRAVLLGQIALPALAGFGLLVKFSVGLLAACLVVALLLQSQHWRKATAVAAGSFAASVLFFWLATGNSPANLYQYLKMSFNVASGYSGAMSLEVGRTDEWVYALLFILALALLLRWASPTQELRRPFALWLAYAAFAWIALKEGFVRHDGHDLEFFGLMSVALLSVPWHSLTYIRRLLPISALACLLTWTAAASVPSNVVSLATGVHSFASETEAALGATGTAIMTSAQRALVANYALPSAMLAKISGQTVAVEPYENTVAWAYPHMRWDPEPVLQQYSAYTSSLDQLNTQFLVSRHAPRFILAQPVVTYEGIDQDPYFESPSADVQTVCHYVQVIASGQWQLLRHSASRCGAPRPLSTVHASFGSSIQVPKAPRNSIVVATFTGVGTSLIYKVENLILKARAIQMTSNVGSYRFIAATAGQEHIMSAPSNLGYDAEYAPPQITDFALYERDLTTNGGRYTVHFYAIALV